MNRGRVMLVTGLVALMAAPVAMAHVEVLPSTAVKGESTEFTVRVPAEEGLTTTQVRVTFPTEVSVYAIADAPGWTTKILKRGVAIENIQLEAPTVSAEQPLASLLPDDETQTPRLQ